MKIKCSLLLDKVPFGPKEYESSTVDDLAKAIARDHQYFVAALERLTRELSPPEQHERIAAELAAKSSVYVEFTDEPSDDEKAALQRLATEYMRGERCPGLDREVEIDFHFNMPTPGPPQ
jgi:hypothetical protein